MRTRPRPERLETLVAVPRGHETVHAAPVGGFSFTSCCDRTVPELPAYDRLSRHPDEVTCGRLSRADELLLAGVGSHHIERLIYDMAVSLRSLRGPDLPLGRALACVQAAIEELVPVRDPGDRWPAALLVRITQRADELAARG
ncbi:MAG TPA: hypothetical protein VMB79_04630 [Jatrophihabitans sp.]|nr:hypothetical protein [Jatrophihabitans sp.]